VREVLRPAERMVLGVDALILPSWEFAPKSEEQ